MHQTQSSSQHGIPPPLPTIKDTNYTSSQPHIQSGGTLLLQPCPSVSDESRRACHNFLCMKRLSQNDDHGYIFIFSCYQVQPVIQNGPKCGMVALEMASTLVKGSYVTTEEILTEARERGLSKQGEMFSGIFVAVKASDMTEELLSNCRREPDVPMLYYWPDDPGPVLCDQLSKLVCEKAEDLFVLGHHGKSKYAGLWPLKDLLLSNDNLLEPGPDKSLEDYVIPPGGVEAGLRSRFITINMKS